MRFSLISLLLVGAGALVGCEAPGVGDPCIPEAIPVGGFVDSEVYLETSSVQCRTRVCMVYRFAGDPRLSEEDCFAQYPSGMIPPPDGRLCSSLPRETDAAGQGSIEERVFCTCRCDTNTDGASTCECPGGFTCQPILDEEAGPGISGSYCVRSDALL